MSLKWLVLLPVIFACASGWKCKVRARTDAGWVCGQRRLSSDGNEYASFRGVPYAKQPLGELRFKELQPVEPWKGFLNATTEGPVCPFHFVFYGSLMKPQGVSEACTFANIHVPKEALPCLSNGMNLFAPGLPILVYIHGGGWIDGSGDSDVNGPEYLVRKGVIVITFNYRMDVFGFLSLNTTKIPGNNGLRDMVTLLRWVRNNARSFGGNPEDVTLAGQSAGASSAHILSLSPVTDGLFKRIWLMSGTAIPSFYTTSPTNAQQVANAFLTALGVSTTDYDAVHDLLVRMPLEEIMNASATVLAQYGVTSFVPVTESLFPNITTIIAEDPEVLMAKGFGNKIPLVIGFTNAEVETSRPRLETINILDVYAQNPSVGLSPNLLFTFPDNATAIMAQRVAARYFGNESVTMDRYIKMASETYFQYPALKLVRARAASGGAPVFSYKYSYDSEYSVYKIAKNLTYTGAGHSEDLTRLLKVNSLQVPASSRDDSMTDWMTDLFVNFMKYGHPAHGHEAAWPAQAAGPLRYQAIASPQFSYVPLTESDQQMVEFFDNLTKV